MMCYRDYFEIPVMNPIDKAERTVWQEIPTRTVHITRPTIRGFCYPFHTCVDFRREGASGDGTPLCVPLHRGFHLGRRCRMKAKPDVRHQYAS